MITENNIYRRLLLYAIVIAVLIDSYTMYRYLTNSPLFGKSFSVVLGLLCFIYIFSSKRLNICKSFISRVVLIVLYLFLYNIVSRSAFPDFLKSYIGVFILFSFLAYFLYQNNDYEYFIKAFCNVMLIICCLSLFFWLFGSILNIIPGRSLKEYYWTGRYQQTYTYYYLYFENISQNKGYAVVRNLGVFLEAPGFSGFLIYALISEMVLKKIRRKIDKRGRTESNIRVTILTITMLSTGSTKGILAVMIAFVLEYISKGSKNNYVLAVKILAGVLICVGVWIIGNELVESKMSRRSGIVRMDDLIAGVKTFINNPLWGVGYRNVKGIQQYQQVVDRANNGLSMGIAVILAYGGLWLSMFYIWAIVLSRKIPLFKNNSSLWYLVVILLVYNLFISNSGFSNEYIFILASVYSYIGIKHVSKSAKLFDKSLAECQIT